MLSRFLKILSLLFIFNSFAYSSYMYYEHCIEDFYFQDGYFYYLRSSDNEWHSSSSFYKYRFDDGYDYNSTSEECIKKPILKDLQISNNSYHSLLALSGVLVGFTFLFFGVYIASDVAKK